MTTLLVKLSEAFSDNSVIPGRYCHCSVRARQPKRKERWNDVDGIKDLLRQADGKATALTHFFNIVKLCRRRQLHSSCFLVAAVEVVTACFANQLVNRSRLLNFKPAPQALQN